MARRSCQSAINLLPRHTASLRRVLAENSANGSRAWALVSAAKPPTAGGLTQVRRLHNSPSRRESDDRPMGLGKRLLRPFANRMQQIVPNVTEPYRVYGVTGDICTACAEQADYAVSEEARKQGTLETMEDGEEIGTGNTMWHTEFGLPPTFSTWSHVTMLHLWLITVRMRCLDKDTYQTWHKQLTDHFFYGAEIKMERLHDIGSASLRQRYLKDLFLQWRGALLSYDHGLATDDATLASAVWRNVFKANEDIDARLLAAVVSWMRLCLRQLGEMNDEEFLVRGPLVFKNRAAWELLVVDRPVPELEGLLGKQKAAQ